MCTIESAWLRRPDYRIDITPVPGHVRVTKSDLVLADTDRALLLDEENHALVVYIPAEDVDDDLFRASDHHTICPFKGQASYRTLDASGVLEENVLWFYPDPFPEVAPIRDHVAFYADRVDVETSTEPSTGAGSDGEGSTPR